MIHGLVKSCIELEAKRGIAELTLKELSPYLYEFADYCRQNFETVEQINSEFIRGYVQDRGAGLGPTLIKAVLWSLRKFGAYLALQSILTPTGSVLMPLSLHQFAVEVASSHDTKSL